VSDPLLVTLDPPDGQPVTADASGAAAAQIILASLGVEGFDPAALYREAHALSTEEPGWKVAPDGITRLLNAKKPAQLQRDFVCCPDRTSDQAARRIVTAIRDDGIAPAVLIWKCRHWAVVTGFEAHDLPIAMPADIAVPAGTIDGFYLRNPCQPGGGTTAPDDHHIDYRNWDAQYMSGVPHGIWHTKRIVICNGRSAMPPVELGITRDPVIALRDLISEDDARRCAVEAIHGPRFARHPRWRAAASGTEPGTPMLLTRLNFPDDHAYIVPMQRAGHTVLLLILDGYDGSYRESAPTEYGWPHSIESVYARFDAILAEGAIQAAGDPVAHPIWPRAVSVFPTLVWRPCLESLSPYLPFLQIHTGNRLFHIRLDGQVFGDLTLNFSGA
jgi:hypothetical protein